ncbi:hypothetical protein [Lacipirellula parvula]|uniref:Uncharacterized protein n=1 Tax=Lacipirellula parvula TaxID=2650471 RepID=A0A5K7XBT3_9BACT|nr:hypothetical protein [Lacipirellula parvula]BBO30549.1 hypothetical protein PLANPX_0161 [Lacipirellula parvula]
MNDNQLKLLEQRLGQGSYPAPAALRDEVLSQAKRELRATRWDRRLLQSASVLLAIGIGLNLLLGLDHKSPRRSTLAVAPSQQSLVQTAVAIAETTDAETGRRFVRQIAFINGWTLNAEQTAEIDAAMKRQANPSHL